MHRMAPAAAVGLAVLGLCPAAVAGTIEVRPGDSIQAAVDRARPGDRVIVDPGTYRERGRRCPANPKRRCAVVVTRSRIRLVARSGRRPVVLRSRGRQVGGIAVGRSRDPGCLTRRSKRVHGARLSGFTVRGFRNGIWLFCTDRFRVTRARVHAARAHGILVSHSLSGRIDHSTASGARHAGIHVGESRGVSIDRNTATRNVSGLEIANSTRVSAERNLATRNSAGIVSYALPARDVEGNQGNRVAHNRVGSNNRPNTCVGRAGGVCRIPEGTGILVLAADRHRVEANRVRANSTFGIAVTSFCTGLNLPSSRCSRLGMEPNPDGNLIASNLATGNGTATDPPVPEVYSVDLGWDLTGEGNCWTDNVAGEAFPPSLPDCRPPGVGPPIQVGIGEQDLSIFEDPLFAEIGIKRARIIVPWDVVTSPVELSYVGDWLAAARARGVEPFVHFTRATDSRCPNEPCRLPSVAEYAEAFGAFRRQFPFLRVFGVWNEANHPSQPTFSHPEQAAEYYKTARAECRECQIVAADVLDGPNMSSWISTFQRHAGDADIWGLHNYRDVNANPGERTGGTVQFLTLTTGQVWLTETGGIVKFTPDGRTEFPPDEERADRAVKRTFELARTYRSRISRIYLYNWRASGPEWRWDSGLLRSDGSPRPAYFTARDTLRSPDFQP